MCNNDCKCAKCRVARFRRKRKKQRVIYKGGRCLNCNYSDCCAALEFHHINPEKKNFQLSDGNTKSWQKEEDELKKCIILCSNCHKKHHYEGLDIESLKHKQISHEEGIKRLQDFNLLPKILKENRKCNCVDCGCQITLGSKRCVDCHAKSREKINWPPKDELKKMCENKSYVKVAKDLGVSDTSVRKRLKKY